MILINIIVIIFLSSGLTQLRIPSCYLKVGILIETSLKKEIDKINFKKKVHRKTSQLFLDKVNVQTVFDKKDISFPLLLEENNLKLFCWTQ